MNYSLYIARRLSLSGNGGKRTPATAVATAAVALSVMVMLASVAIVTGFKSEITERVTGFNSHITLSAIPDGNDDIIMRVTPTLRNLLDSTDYITEYGIQISMPGILKTPTDFKGVYVRGLPTEAARRFIASNIVSGKLPDPEASEDKSEILISSTAARQLGLKAGDRTDVYFMSDEVRVRRLTISGIYNSHFDTYDNVYVYAPLPLLHGLAGLSPDEGVALSIQTNDFSKVNENTDNLQRTLSAGAKEGSLPRLYQADNALELGANYFRWLSLLDMNVNVVISLMTAVACITLISGMLIIILDKKRFIGLMKALGTPSRKLRRIFIFLALRIAITGMIIGNVVMLGLLWLQRTFHLIHLDPEAYYIDFVPVEISWPAVAILNAGIFIVAYLTLTLPSRFVSKISPAELLRGE